MEGNLADSIDSHVLAHALGVFSSAGIHADDRPRGDEHGDRNHLAGFNCGRFVAALGGIPSERRRGLGDLDHPQALRADRELGGVGGEEEILQRVS